MSPATKLHTPEEPPLVGASSPANSPLRAFASVRPLSRAELIEAPVGVIARSGRDGAGAKA
jgi:hypothetical protein